jgi:hypothetical protein
VSWEWWYLPTTSSLTKLKQEHHKYETSLGYIARPLFQSQGDTERDRENERERKNDDRRKHIWGQNICKSYI